MVHRSFMQRGFVMSKPWEFATPSPFTLSVETDAGTYTHGFHLGTIESVAVHCAEEFYRNRKSLKIGTRIVTVALMRDGKVFDCFDGFKWSSALDC